MPRSFSSASSGFAATLVSTAVAASAFAQSYWRFEETVGFVVQDSGPNGLVGTLNAFPARVAEVAVDPVPFTDESNQRSLDLNWQSTSSGGVVQIPDIGGLLSFGPSRDFTVEAWVKLDQLSDTSAAGQRQHLCQKKAIAGDATTDYAIRVQRGDNSPGTAYGKTSGFSGRELQVVFGDGSGQWSVTSHLEIVDLDWHFVSVACDVSARTIRFGLDGVFETIAYGPESRTVNPGPLLLGARWNASGALSQFLRGSIDEVRVSPRVVPLDQLLDAPAQDCNANGVADYQDLASGSSGDCNGNGVPDECDLADGTGADCNGDGVLDSCALAEFVYSIDDGEGDISVRTDGTWMAWLNQFTVEPGFETITAVETTFGSSAVGQPVTFYVWSDPNGDGEPSDATVLTSHSIVVEPGMDDPDVVVRFEIPPVEVGPSGTSYFVGIIVDVELTSSDFPASGDWDAPNIPGRSWLVGAFKPIDPNNLTFEAVEYGLFEDLLPPGNWIMRAVAGSAESDCNGNGVPDSCDIESGSSADVDANGVPDECQFPGTYLVPDQFGSIQAAIAAVADGSEIVVQPGTYFEHLVFLGKSIVVRSESGPESTVIDGGGAGSVVVFRSGEGPATRIEGFTITNGGGSAGSGGAGVLVESSSPTIRGNRIVGNTTNLLGGGLIVYGFSSPRIEENLIADNAAGDGGGIYIQVENTRVFVHRNTIEDNVCNGGFGGGVLCWNGSLELVGNEIAGNVGADSGGGVFVLFSGDTPHHLEANEILDNVANDDGGGLWFANGGAILLVNNLITGNAAPSGAGLYARGTGTRRNCTISGNLASSEGGGLYYGEGGGDLSIANSIVRGNLAPSSPELFYTGGAQSISFSNIGGGWPGFGNLDADPRFVDANAGDYRLAGDSPCIDAGDNGVVPFEIETDLAGEARFVDDPNTPDTGSGAPPVVDLGAYEFQGDAVGCPADLDGDGVVGASDLATCLGQWGQTSGKTGPPLADLDGDGVVGAGDLAMLLSAWGLCG
ncbi:MAG: right-handed parallel beta-helix repeat-containing protein [Phycisphaerales bacterium]